MQYLPSTNPLVPWVSFLGFLALYAILASALWLKALGLSLFGFQRFEKFLIDPMLLKPV